MLQKVLGKALMSKARKRLSGGAGALKPIRPTKGSGIASGAGQPASRTRRYVTPRQNPALSPRTGGLAMRGTRVKRGKQAVAQGSLSLRNRRKK